MGDTLIGERGPQGNRHLPAYRTGCYHGRATDCCLLCLGRLCHAAATPPDSQRPGPADTAPQRRAKSAVIAASSVNTPQTADSEATAGAGVVTVRINETTSITIDRTADAQLPSPVAPHGADR